MSSLATFCSAGMTTVDIIMNEIIRNIRGLEQQRPVGITTMRSKMADIWCCVRIARLQICDPKSRSKLDFSYNTRSHNPEVGQENASRRCSKGPTI